MTILQVSTAAQLQHALDTAQGGDVIKLAGGNYGALNLTDVSFASNVTITSAGAKQPATFSGLDLQGVSNLTLANVVFDYKFAANDPSYVSPFKIYGGAHVTIRHSTFDGDSSADGYGYGTGLAVTNAQDVHVTGNKMFNFYTGLSVSDSSGTVISGNNVHDIRSDGMDFVHVTGVTIAHNHIHDFRTDPGSLDHPDMIQFWTAGTTAPSTGIVIKGNLLDSGSGPWTQSIFLGNEAAASLGTSMYYRDVTIANNVVVNGHFHGITVGQAIGVKIVNNSVLHTDGAAADGQDPVVEIPQINVAPQSGNVTIDHNLTGGVTGFTGQSGWVVGHNIIAQDQDPNQPHFYGDLFISSSLTPQHGVHRLLATPGGVIDLAGAGAGASRNLLPGVGAVASLFNASVNPSGSVQTRSFDGSISLGHLGALPDTALFHWDFGDGTSATGQKVAHVFKTGGYYNVTLTVSLADGTSDTTLGVIGVQNTDLLSLGSDGKLRIEDYGHTVVLPGGGTASGLHLGGGGVAATVPDAFISNITRVHDFDVVMQLKADSTSSAGEVFRLNGGLTASVTAEGTFQLDAIDGAGTRILLTSGGVSLTDLSVHDIDIRASNGQLQVWVDGAVRSSAAFSGAINSFGPTDLTFGNPWGGQNFFGDVTAFEVKVGENALGQSGHQAAPAPALQAAIAPEASSLNQADRAALTDSFDFTGRLHHHHSTDSPAQDFHLALSVDGSGTADYNWVL